MCVSLLLWNGYDLSQKVGQPDRVYEVKVAEPFQVVIVMEKDSIVVKELGSCVMGSYCMDRCSAPESYVTYPGTAPLGPGCHSLECCQPMLQTLSDQGLVAF